MASPSTVFTEIVTTTLRASKKKLVDNVSKNNALLRRLKDTGKIKTDAGGGYEIQVPLSYAENATYQRFNGLDTLNIGQSDVLTSAKFDWQQAAIHVVSSGRELKMNASEEKMISLANSRIEVAMDTAANNMAIDMYSDGSLANQIGGLGLVIQNAGTGTVGGIDSSTYTFWRNKFQEIDTATATAPTYAKLKENMNKLWLQLVRGTDKPDLIMTSHDFYSILEGGLQDNQRYMKEKEAYLGFESLMYKSAPVVFDDNTNFGTTSEQMYFLNTKYLYLMEHPEARWTEDDEKVPVNQDAVVIPMYWMGNVCCSNRSLQGKLIDLV
jgi:hypothetical protein